MEEAKKWLESLKVEDIISSEFFKEENVAAMRKAFQEHKPFPFHLMKDFLDIRYARQLMEELKTLDYFHRKNDLYEYAGSKDLKGVDSPLVSKFRSVLYSDRFRQLLKDITGIEVTGLEKDVDINSAVYEDGHHLLCHDDQLSGRRIAYILYLVPEHTDDDEDEGDEDVEPLAEKKKEEMSLEDKLNLPKDETDGWTRSDGGALDLFNVDEKGEPKDVGVSVIPRFNHFGFFEVSNVSYHQVAEVTGRKSRLAISGWFHGKAIKPRPPICEPLPTVVPPSPADVGSVDDWVSREYRRPNTVKKIKNQFAEQSSIELPNFLRSDKYEQITKELQNTHSWVRVGPPNKKWFSRFETENKANEGSALAQLQRFANSKEFVEFVQQLTGLDITAGFTQVRRFAHKDYTLLHDHDPEWDESGLDMNLSLLPSGCKWLSTFGGVTHWVEKGEEEELVQVTPGVNTLSLVYRAGGAALSFVKYVNNRAPTPKYDLNVVFRVQEDEDDESEESEESEEEPPKTKGKATKSKK